MSKVKLISLVSILFLFFVFATYLLFFSSSLANRAGIIKVRNLYFDNSYDTYGRSLPNIDNTSLTNSPIRVYSKTKQGSYCCVFIGNIESFDIGSNTIYFLLTQQV